MKNVQVKKKDVIYMYKPRTFTNMLLCLFIIFYILFYCHKNLKAVIFNVLLFLTFCWPDEQTFFSNVKIVFFLEKIKFQNLLQMAPFSQKKTNFFHLRRAL
jgi:hypothetical protein